MSSTNPPTDPRWAWLPEAQVYGRVSNKTLRRWIASGLLPAYRSGPRRVRIDLNDLDAVLFRRIPVGTPRDVA